jgi:hypothetical protein
MIQIIKFLLCTDILYIKWNFVRTFVVRVRRIFLDGAVYMGEAISALFVLSHTNGAKGGGHGNGHGRVPHEGRARAEIPTTHLHTYCVLLRTYSAPKTRIARAPELVAV